MKKFIITLIFGIALYFAMAFTSKMFTFTKPIETMEPKPIVNFIPEAPKVEDFGVDLNGHSAFLGALGHYESSNTYTKVNRYGYMGRYQFGKNTLKGIGINVTKQEFLSNPELQEEAMQRLLKANYKSLKRFINKYEGQTLHGVVVTKSGVLAAAHLGGAGAVRKWFRKGKEFKDGNGTKMTTYMKVFSGYKLDI